MNEIGKYLGQVSPAHIGRGAVIALILLVVPVLFLQVSSKAEAQIEDTDWRDQGLAFLAASDHYLPVISAERPFDLADFETFTRQHIERSISDQQQLDCLTTAIYYEARSESVAGQLAVAQVVLNRVASKHYPASVCEVVYQGENRTTGCQFSFTCDGSLAIGPRDKTWAQVRLSAVNATLGMSAIPLGRATHYHTTAVNPFWSATLLRTADVGAHIFYRFPNRREKAYLTKDI